MASPGFCKGEYMERIFVFDLDSTITRKEILPAIADRFDLGAIVQDQTEAAMRGRVPFEESFRQRVALLAHSPVSEAAELVADIPLNEHIAEFIRANPERCYIATGNLDVWIEELVPKLGIPADHVFCSKTIVLGDRIASVSEVFGPQEKAELVRRLKAGAGKSITSAGQLERYNIVAIGDGANDIEMCRAADVGIAFGGVREVPEGLRSVCEHTFYDDKECAEFLGTF